MFSYLSTLLYIGIIRGGRNALEGHGSRLELCNISVVDDWLFLTIRVMSFTHCVFCNHSSCDFIRDSSFVLHPSIVVKKQSYYTNYVITNFEDK